MTKETIIKSALKGLVKMQIEEGSVGFAVDNDSDHDCCWDDVLAWLEAQSTHGSTYSDVSWVDIRKAYIKGYDYGVKDWFKSKQQPCEDCISREAVRELICQNNDKYGYSDRFHEFTERCLHLPSVKPQYTDEEIDKAQAVEQAYVDKMVELAVEETKRPKGKWIKCKSRFGVEYFKCSECGRRLDWIDRDDNYCNNCGSDNSESTKEWFKDRDIKLAEITEAEKND